MMSNKTFFCVVGILLGVVGTVLAIYLTPLKHFNLVEPTMREMDPAAFWTDYNAHPGTYLFVDVRNAADYNAVHAPGAVNMPIATLSDQYKTLPRQGKFIALICGDGRLAKVAYGFLEDYGFRNLIHITGGLENWILEGLPAVRAGSATSSPSAQSNTVSLTQGCPKIS